MKTESVIAAVIMFLLVVVVAVSSVMAYRYKSAVDRADTAESQVNTQVAVISSQQAQLLAFNSLAGGVKQQNTEAAADSRGEGN